MNRIFKKGRIFAGEYMPVQSLYISSILVV